MKRTLTVTFGIVFSLLVFGQAALAIPAFARKYGYNCNMCHVAFPKLNDWGQRFRDNGYQTPGQSGFEETVFETGVPVAFRTNAGYSLYRGGEGTTSGFHLYGLDLLAAGVLHKNISFLFVYTPRVDEPAADFTGPGNGDNPAQLAAIESANVIFSNIIRDKLNLRIGRFEPGFQLLSSKRNYYILQPFESYGYVGSRNRFDFSANHIGVEATGRFKPGLKYALGFINGSGANPDNNRFADLYLALSKTFGRGEGQSAGQRFGVFGYLARKFQYEMAPLVLALVLGPMMENNVRLSLVISQGDPMIFVTHPISAGLMAVTFVLLVSPFIPWIGKRRKKLQEKVRGEEV